MASTRPWLHFAVASAEVTVELFDDGGLRECLLAYHIASLASDGYFDDLAHKPAQPPGNGGAAWAIRVGQDAATAGTVFDVPVHDRASGERRDSASVTRGGDAGLPTPTKAIAAAIPPPACGSTWPTPAAVAVKQGTTTAVAPYVVLFDPKGPSGSFLLVGGAVAAEAVPSIVAARAVVLGTVVRGRAVLDASLRSDATGLCVASVRVDLPALVPSPAAGRSHPRPRSYTVAFATSLGPFKVELFHRSAPRTVANIADLVASGFYDGQHVHRVVAGFVAQMGCPNSKTVGGRQIGSGTPQPNTEFKALPIDQATMGDIDPVQYRRDAKGQIQDEFEACVSNTAYTMAMANSGAPNSSGSQFFINLATNRKLDWFDTVLAPNSKHVVCGAVTSGFDVIDALGRCKTDPSTDMPVNPVRIESARLLAE